MCWKDKHDWLKKFKFKADDLMYIRYKIPSRGIEADDSKIKTIMAVPKPTDKKVIQKILDMINYVA